MRKAYFFLIALIAWGFLFWWHYVYNIKQLGASSPESAVVTTPAPSESTAAPTLILFKPKTYGLIINGGNEALLDSILSDGGEGQLLQITGLHAPEEQVGLDFDLGMARAAELKKLMINRLSEDQIEIYSDSISNFTYSPDSLIDGIFYEWVDGYQPVESVESVEETNYYLVDHDNKRIKIELYEDLFSKIAEKLISTGKKVIIRGHTDDKGDKELNFTIALRNAKDIRDVFKAKGVNRSQIETTSRGEEDPIADNELPEGRKANRRIEIEIEE